MGYGPGVRSGGGGELECEARVREVQEAVEVVCAARSCDRGRRVASCAAAKVFRW